MIFNSPEKDVNKCQKGKFYLDLDIFISIREVFIKLQILKTHRQNFLTKVIHI